MISFALVCASNQNRSMAAHKLFQMNGIPADSYGTGSQVKLPGKTLYTPNVYNFGTPYEEIANDLRKKDEKL
jgi:RNA polymerase II subunit A C-terminal domain phosphatase SSU72